MPYYNDYARNSLTNSSTTSIRTLDEEEQESTGLAPPLFNIITGQESYTRKGISQRPRRRRALNYKQSFGSIFNLIYGSNNIENTESEPQSIDFEKQRKELEDKLQQLEKFAAEAKKMGDDEKYALLLKEIASVKEKLRSFEYSNQIGTEGNANGAETSSDSYLSPPESDMADMGCTNGTCVDEENEITPPSTDSLDFGIPSATNESMDDIDDISNGSGVSNSMMEDDEKK